MAHVTIYAIRHQKKGIITDRLFLKKPSPEEVRRLHMKYATEGQEGWTTLIPLILHVPDELKITHLLDALTEEGKAALEAHFSTGAAPSPVPQSRSMAAIQANVPVISAVGVVTNPKPPRP